MKLSLILKIIFILLLFCNLSFAQDLSNLKAQELSHSYSENFSKDALLKKTYKFRNYKVMGKDFKYLCDLLHQDGRRDLFIRILQENNKNKVKGCPACKPFYKVFAKACRKSSDSKKKIKVKKKIGKQEEKVKDEESKEIKIYKQRDPSLTVVDYVSYLFTELAKNQENSDQTYKAIKDFINKMTAEVNKTKGELDYIKNIKNYFLAPFDAHLQAEEERAKKEKDNSETKWRIAE